MTRTDEDLLAHALAMPAAVRAEIAERLLDSLEPERAEVDAAWGIEAERRVNQLDSGEVQLLDGEEVMANLRKRF
jgi:putative addiction module component (TIGR02574 family)